MPRMAAASSGNGAVALTALAVRDLWDVTWPTAERGRADCLKMWREQTLQLTSLDGDPSSEPFIKQPVNGPCCLLCCATAFTLKYHYFSFSDGGSGGLCTMAM